MGEKLKVHMASAEAKKWNGVRPDMRLREKRKHIEVEESRSEEQPQRAIFRASASDRTLILDLPVRLRDKDGETHGEGYCVRLKLSLEQLVLSKSDHEMEEFEGSTVVEFDFA